MIEVWLFYPDRSAADTQRFRATIQQLCASKGWSFQSRPAKVAERGGRPLAIVRADDSRNLYKRCHQVKVGVATVDQCSISLDPRFLESLGQNRSVMRVIADKACWMGSFPLGRAIRGGPLTATERARIDSLERWQLADWQAGNDPRALPLYVFSPGLERWTFRTAGGRQRFGEKYGPPARRMDDRGLFWIRADHFHGAETVRLAGIHELPRGFHWDVTQERRRSTELTTLTEAWRVRDGGYINVYPDAYIRSGRNSTRVFG
jgi:hypothetical protein